MTVDFPDNFSGILRIKLSEPPERISPNLLNLKSSPSATIVSLELDANILKDDGFQPLTEADYQHIAFQGASITLRGESRESVEHHAPNGEFFTVRDMIRAVEETERQTRGNSEWYDGVDVHHIFFEGIRANDDGTWSIRWGS
jgi:hypothetical protein